MATEVVVLCNYPFPEGMAATIRILAYSKGLTQNGVKCSVVTFCPRSDMFPKSGFFNGVNYYHSHLYSSKSKIRRVFLDLYLFKVKSILLLNNLRRNNKILVFIAFDDLWNLMIFVPLLKLLKFNLAFISDEFPPTIRSLKNQIGFFEKAAYYFLHRKFDFRIVMTKALLVYYNDNFGFLETIVLNTVVDTERFASNTVKREFSPHKSYKLFRICYMGNMELRKDNVDLPIRAVISLLKRGYRIKFDLYGSPSRKDKEFLLDLIAEYYCEKDIYIFDRVNYSEVPQLLQHYDLLVNSQPNTVRATGGFPTKLGEYLLSGIPALFSSVGDIPIYIQDSINGFLVKPMSIIEYSKRIEYIMSNYEIALSVANEGYKFVLNNFETKNSLRELSNFISKKYSSESNIQNLHIKTK